jgi:hypothetical protein
MKNINVKKIVAGAAALGVGALMLSGAMAENMTPGDWSGVSREDLFNESGAPAVNIMVGSMAQPIDVVWAGNIAAAIGKHAHTTVEGSEGGYTFNSVTVEVGTEGTTTIGGDGKLFDDIDIGGTFSDTLDVDDYGLLYDEDESIDDDENNVVDDEINVQDSLTVNAAVAFDDDEDVGALTATVNKGDIVYKVEFDDGVPFGYDGSGSPKFKFNFLGKEYQVDELNDSGNTLTLIEGQSTVTYGVGDTFNPEEGYTVEVVNILDNGASEDPYEAELALKDSEGTIVATDVFQSGDEDIFEDYLTASIDVDTVYSSQIKMITGSTGKLKLKDGDEIEDFPENGDELWKIELVEGTTGYVTSITMENNDSDVEWKNEDALRVGDSIQLPNDFASIDFVGLTEENETEFTIEDGMINYTDDDEEDHEIFIYNYDTGTDITEWTTEDTIDGKEIYIAIDGTDGDLGAGDQNYTASVTFQLEDDDGDYLQSDGSWDSAVETWYIDSGDNSLSTTPADSTADPADFVGWLEMPEFETYNNSDEKLDYGLFITEAADKITDIALGLEKDAGDDGANYAIYGGDATWKLDEVSYGVDDYDDTGTYAGDKDGTHIVTGDLESVIKFTVTDDTTGAPQDTSAYVDPYTGDLVDTEDNEYVVGSVQVDGVNADLGIHDSEDLTEAITNFGSFYYIDSGKFGMNIPEDQLQAQFFIGGGSTIEPNLIGATLTLTEEGELVTNEDGDISAKLVSKDIDATGFDTAIVPASWDPTTLVHLDTATAGANPKVIVGGHLVNTLAEGITNDLLTESGQYVYGKTPEGNIVVAGWDAVDTEDAARELIAAIEAM